MDIEKNVLTLKVDHEEKIQENHSGEGKKQEGSEPSAPTIWHRTERSRLFVQRSVALPETADTSAAHASYVDGVLSITFPRKPLVESTTKLTIN